MKIPYYTIYDSKHFSGKAHGGTAVIIRNDIKHYLHSRVNKEYIQATTVTVQTSSNNYQLSAVYVPPRHKITSQIREEYFQQLGASTSQRETTTQSTRSGDQETLHLEVEHWKNTLEIITSIYYPQEHRHIGRLT